MRLVASSQEREKSARLAEYLNSQGISNQLETVQEGDWGNPDYGSVIYRIWVYDEDQFEKALTIASEYFASPEDSHYHEGIKPNLNAQIIEPIDSTALSSLSQKLKAKRLKRAIPWSKEPVGMVTLYFLSICCLLFFITQATSPNITGPFPASLPIPIFFPEVEKELLFDYPEAFDYLDKLIKAFGWEKLQHPEELPKEGITLLKQFENTPYWQGYYDETLSYLKDPGRFQPSKAPLFEKIRQGEIWRLFSPCLLHGNIFHILFNMMWLVVMGRQLEQRMGRLRYFIFILFTGIIANVAQYLAGGADFIGFSGVLCAMLTFAWVRQKYYPWEGYQLEPSTFGFMMLFLFSMLTIQLISFYTEFSFGQAIAPPIANAAHMSGLAMGLILGHFNFFSWR